MTDCFVAVDVETANQNRHSICQIGLVAFQGADEIWRWSTRVNPEEEFDGFNVGIHGIRSSDVVDAPQLPTVLSHIAPSMDGQFVVSHTMFDYQALNAAAEKHSYALPMCTWLDSCAIARRAWSTLDNHKLGTLGKFLGLEFKHHDALADAYVCGQILIRALAETSTSLRDWTTAGPDSEVLDTGTSSGRRRYSEKIEMKGRDNAPLSGHVVVFTGEFSIGEERIARIAASLGCDVEDRFSKKRTTMVVLGQRDPNRFNGKLKSNKLMAAEAAELEGCQLDIMDEQSFLTLAEQFALSDA